MHLELPEWFSRFVNLGADRFGELMAALEAAGCEPRPVELAGGRFIVAAPRESVRDRRYRMKVITAHHDRVPGTPGALDNSAACLQLLRFVTADRRPGEGPFNTVAVFTDHEELSGAPVNGQGAYALGKAFAGLGYGLPLVLSLDVTGRGDALVLSSSCSGLADMPRMKAEQARLAGQDRGRRQPVYEALAAEVEALADSFARYMAGRMPVYRLPVPFGEDIGFMLAGVPALVCTVLPRHEADQLSGLGGLDRKSVV